MRLRPAQFLVPLLLLAVPLASDLNAQTTTSGGLTGVITDQSNAVVPNTDVEIKDNAKSTRQSTKTDREGVYRFFFLAPSTYTLKAFHDGFRPENRAVNVLLGPPATVNLTLEVAEAKAKVTVTDEPPLIQSENGDISTTIGQEQISELPNPGNDLTYIAQTAPGAVMNTDFGGAGNGNFSSLGMPGTSNLFTIDGMNINDNALSINVTGPSNLLLGQNQIQEANVISVGYSGQFGNAAGAYVNYITRSGGNKFHGNAEYFWNGRVLNANDWLSNAYGVPRPFDIAHQWAGSFGGPIKKSKLFFFFDSEGLRLLIPQSFFVTIPTSEFETATIANIDSMFGVASASDTFYRKIFNLYDSAHGAVAGASPVTPLGSADNFGCTQGFVGPNGLGTTQACAARFLAERGRQTNETLTSGRLDWNVSAKDRAFLRVQFDGGHDGFDTDPISPVFDAGYSQPWWQGQVIETHTFNSYASSQFLLAGTYFAGVAQLNHPAQAVAAFPTTLNFTVANTFSSLAEANNAFAYASGRPTTQYQISEDVVKITGRHSLSLGAGFNRIYWTPFFYQNNVPGTLFPQTLDAFYQGGLDPATPAIDFTELTQSFVSQSRERIAFYSLGLYGQDEWRARPNLTLTFALRGDHQSNPVCRRRCFARTTVPFESLSHDPDQPYNQAILIDQKQAFEKTDTVLWSPRFSFAWQPFGTSHNSHKTVLRGGIGIFFDPLPGIPAAVFSGSAPLLNTYSVVGDNLTPHETTSLFRDAAASNAAFVDGFYSGQTLAQIQGTVSGLRASGFSPPAMTLPDRVTHSPQYQRWSLQLQQGLGVGTSLSMGYFGHHGIHGLIQNANANAYGFGSLPPALCASPPVPPCSDPRFGAVTEFFTGAVSNYNGMVASVQYRFRRWTQGLFQANYTYSHTFDEVSNGGFNGFTNTSLGFPQDPNNLRGAYGPADYDVRHSFNASYVWELPVKAVVRSQGPDFLTKGWQFSGTIFARTGFPYTVIDVAQSGKLAQQNSFGLIYSVPAGPLGSGPLCGEGAALPLAPHPCQPPEVLADGTPNPQARFLQSGCETGFNSGHLGAFPQCDGPLVTFAQGRNHFRGPSYFDTDLTIMKKTKIGHRENAVLGLGVQFFNLFNHPNFGFPDIFSSDQTFGQIMSLEQPPTSILGAIGNSVSPRMIQLKAELQF
jgi:hypothetical protein